MKVTQEKLPASQVALTIELPPSTIESTYERTLQKLAREVRIKGFRPGKVPRRVLVQQLGSSVIKATALETLLGDYVGQALKQEEIKALGNYDIKPSFDELVGEFQVDQPLKFTAIVDVYPTITLDTYTGLTVQAEDSPYDPNRVDETLAEYQKKLSTLVPVDDRAAALGDVAVLDYEGFLDLPEDAPEDATPEPIEGAKATDSQVDLEQDNFIPGFVDGILGMQPGETKTVQAKFPEGYAREDLSGRSATFQITLKELKIRELHPLTDDFAQTISDYETLDDLRAGLEKRFQQEAEDTLVQHKTEAWLEKLGTLVSGELPESLIRQETNYMINQMAMRLEEQGINVKALLNNTALERIREEVRPNAITQLKQKLAVGEVARQENLTVDPDALSVRISNLLSGMPKNQSVDVARLRAIVEEEMLQAITLDWIFEHNTTELVEPGTLSTTTPETTVDLTDEPEASDQTVTVSADPVD